MTIPGYLAHPLTSARARKAIRRTRTEHAAAHDALMALKRQIDASVRLKSDLPYAAALLFAADVAHESATLELAWLDRPNPTSDTPTVHAATILWSASEVYEAATAPGYNLTTLSRRSSDEPWQNRTARMMSRLQAWSIAQRWIGKTDTYVLADGAGWLFVAQPTWRMELTPMDLTPPHTEGDALRAALAAFDFPAYDDGEGGCTWLSVPLDPAASETEMYLGPHFRISSGEWADRPASAHDEAWGASVYDADGDYVTTLDAAPDGSTLAQDCALTARAVAEYARAQH